MKILEYYSCENQVHWLEQIGKSDWGAGTFLHELLKEDRLREFCGSETKVLLLTEGEELMSFCTYAWQDDVRDESLFPWVGFVYTFPEYRGKRRMGKLLEYAYALAKVAGHAHIYISTGEEGLYEKYGYQFWRIMKDIHGEDSRIYRIAVTAENCEEEGK